MRCKSLLTPVQCSGFCFSIFTWIGSPSYQTPQFTPVRTVDANGCYLEQIVKHTLTLLSFARSLSTTCNETKTGTSSPVILSMSVLPITEDLTSFLSPQITLWTLIMQQIKITSQLQTLSASSQRFI